MAYASMPLRSHFVDFNSGFASFEQLDLRGRPLTVAPVNADTRCRGSGRDPSRGGGWPGASIAPGASVVAEALGVSPGGWMKQFGRRV